MPFFESIVTELHQELRKFSDQCLWKSVSCCRTLRPRNRWVYIEYQRALKIYNISLASGHTIHALSRIYKSRLSSDLKYERKAMYFTIKMNLFTYLLIKFLNLYEYFQRKKKRKTKMYVRFSLRLNLC